MQRQGMLNEFIAATEKAEKLEGRAFLKILTKVKGGNLFFCQLTLLLCMAAIILLQVLIVIMPCIF